MQPAAGLRQRQPYASAPLPVAVPAIPTATATTLTSSLNTLLHHAMGTVALFILRLVHWTYAVCLLAISGWTVLRRLYTAPLRTLRSALYWAGRYARHWGLTSALTVGAPRRLSPSDFKRLPQTLAFSFGATQFTADEQSLVHEDLSAVTASSPQPDVTRCAELVLACCELAIPELILFDRREVLTTSWPTLAASLARAQPASPCSSDILVLQGAAAADSQRGAACQLGAEAKMVALVYEGTVEIVGVETLLRSAGESASPSFSSSSASVSSSAGAADWRSAVRSHVHHRLPTVRASLTSEPRVFLISCLGSVHAEEAIVHASVERARRRVNGTAVDAAVPAPPTKRSPHDLRQDLQTTLLPLPLREPDLLLVVHRSSSLHRSLLSFPPWLLRVAEIFHAFDAHALVRGGEMAERLQQFGRTVQRGGT